jgi:hypothetical protein
MEKHELSKIDFELIDDAFKALLQSRPDPAVADMIPALCEKGQRRAEAGLRLLRG